MSGGGLWSGQGGEKGGETAGERLIHSRHERASGEREVFSFAYVVRCQSHAFLGDDNDEPFLIKI